jgi:hypothetical protein
LLPDLFLTWNTVSANNIRRWLPRNGNAHAASDSAPHSAVVGGRPDLLAGAPPDPLAASFSGLCRGFRRIVLLSMDCDPIEPILLEAMAAAPEDWLWLVRCHPWAVTNRMADAWPDDVRTLLDRAGVANHESHLASQLDLPAVMRCCTHHVTRISSCTLEAFHFDLPTTFVHPTAIDQYGSLIEAGHAWYTRTPDGIIESIERGWDGLTRDTGWAAAVDDGRARCTMAALLAGRLTKPSGEGSA